MENIYQWQEILAAGSKIKRRVYFKYFCILEKNDMEEYMPKLLTPLLSLQR